LRTKAFVIGATAVVERWPWEIQDMLVQIL
jgi:hypothetical protein